VLEQAEDRNIDGKDGSSQHVEFYAQ